MKRFEFPLERVMQWREKQVSLEESRLERLNSELTILDARRRSLDQEQIQSARAVVEASSVTAAQLESIDLFRRYAHDPAGLPPEWAQDGAIDEPSRLRRTADFIAGMTDRYALIEHARLFDSTPELR